ncbi:hypothetical protein DESC_700002 [Desulfosarcina cetonica]|uniref:hypothetical protein n=1 Tax=Desulfosarcina cetonica TaxID=90730 RepID=UPI0012ED932D|nr:hypothetical protein [Desulfosarcina cetonica]VTR68246.1 hypothetical protein DESC_700002 [Desulfosarcina cetonica]
MLLVRHDASPAGFQEIEVFCGMAQLCPICVGDHQGGGTGGGADGADDHGTITDPAAMLAGVTYFDG